MPNNKAEIILPDPITKKRYNAQSSFLKKRFGKKTVKISLNGNFTCPNIDGTKGVGGCAYCSSSGSGDFAGKPFQTIAEQFEYGKRVGGRPFVHTLFSGEHQHLRSPAQAKKAF